MGRYKKYHDVVVLDPFGAIAEAVCGPAKKTILIDKKTGKRVEGYGRSYEESDRKAWKKLHKK